MDNQQLLALTEKYGSPLYVYDANIIESQYHRMVNAFSSVKSLNINYAVKANSNINILKVLKNLDAGVDCVSIQEVLLAIEAGFEVNKIFFTPSGISIEEMEKATALGVQITLDSLSVTQKFGEKHPNIPICLRINPHVMAGGNHKISVGHIDSKFGISIHQIEDVKKIISETGLKVIGIHMHTGSDIYNIEAFLTATEILLNTVKEFDTIEFVDFGSGFKVPYKEGDIETNIEEMGETLSKRFNDFCTEYGRDLTLIFEPGKFLVSAAGCLLVKVNVVKPTPNIVFIGVDSGLNHLLRPMMYDSYHHITNISNPEGKEKIYDIVGYICENDTFGSNRSISKISENDILCIHNAGAYSFSMASNYNSRYRPAEVMVYNGEDYLIRKRETFEDLLKNQVIIDL
ncbi:diaminopimelate decarboxylase [Lutibacter agarilyticus]|uniref:Diaminopimelate decarboxylase n=1 Tax=Lutibacter agarilyticus TaxID=1109740 RepID=A0A238VJ38_9FLAO|nr:diaminopimelate decarboxylase [Lutibacter agarilyticus]SNR34208.1 diaminopimelate decarboxylase [Lutibacter agarilyticus]